MLFATPFKNLFPFPNLERVGLIRLENHLFSSISKFGTSGIVGWKALGELQATCLEQDETSNSCTPTPKAGYNPRQEFLGVWYGSDMSDEFL